MEENICLNSLPEGVTEVVALQLLRFQPRCIKCGSTFALQIHHRVFKSEGEHVLKAFLKEQSNIYLWSYGRTMESWGLHEIQNLCVLCVECHEGNIVGVHGGNEKLRQFLKHSFTCPYTGFNIMYKRRKTLW